MAHPNVVFMGVAGSGKSTVGEALAQRLGWGYEDADRFHPESNVAKMSAGQPLTDADRWPWLQSIRAAIEEKQRAGETAVFTCSSLKRSYRDVLRGKETDKTRQHRHQELSTWGIGRMVTETQWRAVLRQLIALGHVAAEGEFNTLALQDSARAVLKGEEIGRAHV